jgi:diguanylate cyclase (GGDEF)-like protein/PAS domain S-box-containing protein
LTGVAASGPRTVLVVEDNPGDARLVLFYLREDYQNPFHVLQADRLSQALAILADNAVDVILLDLSLPDSFGLDTLARLRAAVPLIPVVVLTGTKDEGLALDALRQGAQDYMVKGSGDGELVRRSIRYAIERSRADQELRGSEAQFRAVFSNAGIGVVLVDPIGNVIEANRTFSATMGYSETDLKAMNVAAISHSEDLHRCTAMMEEMAAGKRDSYQLQQRFLAKDGRVVWVRQNVTAVRDGVAGTMQYAVAMVEDVTERKRLEDHMRLAATVFENTGEGLFITDAERHIIHVNRAFTDITGYNPDDVLGQDPHVLSSGRHGPDFYARMWHSLETTGRWQGEIWDRRKSGEMFAGWQNIAAVRGADGETSNFVAVISDITSRKQVEERLSYAANHDPLTRLPNRTLFHERLSRALARSHRNQDSVALLFIDLDHFKQVNDTLGHLAGDLLLQKVAERIGNSIRQGDTVARLAGDEFTVILEEVQDPRDAAIVSHKILRVLAEPFDLNGQTANISSSIGVAVYPMDGGDSQTLIKLADAAMYRAKKLGRNGCQFHSEAVNALAFERLVLEESLRGALDRGEFSLHYQPVFAINTGKVVAVEALLRWHHPEVGMVIPAQFLTLAEETGLVLPIGRWAMETACRQVREWHDMGFRELELGFNLSIRELRHPEIIETVAEALEITGLAPHKLILEVPESSITDKGGEPGGIFPRLASLGVHLLVDEFGAGYSSFTFLRRLPANALKISQAFVRNITTGTEDSEIVTAIVAVARGLHMSVAAAGVENDEQLHLLRDFGCDRVQGFLFARPMPADALTDYLKSGEVPPLLAEGKNR